MTAHQDRRDPAIEQNRNQAPYVRSNQPQTSQGVDQRAARIRDLNDRLRTTGRGGMVVLTNGIGALGLLAVNQIFAAVASFTDFTPDSDPWAEHDCGLLSVGGKQVIWKIDYLDRSRRYHSPDPTDPKLTVRVLTVMLAEEY
jgi:Protein of unknown function (DUF3768)